MHPVEKALSARRRHFIGGFRGREINTTNQDKGGTRAQCRLLRQEIKKIMKDEGLWPEFIAEGHEHKLKSASLEQLLNIKKDLLG